MTKPKHTSVKNLHALNSECEFNSLLQPPTKECLGHGHCWVDRNIKQGIVDDIIIKLWGNPPSLRLGVFGNIMKILGIFQRFMKNKVHLVKFSKQYCIYEYEKFMIYLRKGNLEILSSRHGKPLAKAKASGAMHFLHWYTSIASFKFVSHQIFSS